MIVSGWYDGHSTYGLRVLEADVSLYFRPEGETVSVYLPEEGDPVVSRSIMANAGDPSSQHSVPRTQL